ncbi:MAG: hypothetical protein CEO22_390 [Candidatus Berkelbacteria bacterium Gr01-1014_85]|uniref:Response regulatory domain-containing protein n=1 Tax=Candidatus Berkelbacteria bacterium Gr01-1014_85 TaxID=2017150 RepID=A0A554JBJ9_9BACT|nr:MAG: hypothetical protein CEO22_390 [Candidatus Berkelbacteria bacterium Gr01-1014_85]
MDKSASTEFDRVRAAIERSKKYLYKKGMILIVDDKLEERKKARVIVEAAGYLTHTCDFPVDDSDADWQNFLFYLSVSDGVLTDLVNLRGKPQGLLIALEAVSQGKPVVICTNTKEQGGHHGEAIGWIYDGYFARVKTRVGWIEVIPDDQGVWEKNWVGAIELLKQRIKST